MGWKERCFDWSEIRADMTFLWRESWRVVKRHPVIYYVLPVLVLAVAAVLLPYDQMLNRLLSERGRIQWLWLAAGEFSGVGDFVQGTLLLIALIWILGILRKRLDWRRAALACLLASALAGGTANVPRFLVGRPRPNEQVADRPIGPTIDSSYQSFPSGHSATAVATVTSLSFAFPAVSVVLMPMGFFVAFCRMYVNAHYASDILVGSMIGLWFGSIAGIAYRRLIQKN
jgi:membrane-associated phospholipid phosphatase